MTLVPGSPVDEVVSVYEKVFGLASSLILKDSGQLLTCNPATTAGNTLILTTVAAEFLGGVPLSVPMTLNV